MADPFQNVDAAGADFIATFAEAMDRRQDDASMERIVAAYLDALDVPDDGLIVEVGAGAGAVTRRIAARFPKARVLGYEPSEGFVAEARARAGALANLSFEQADGAELPLVRGSADAVIFHTVLSHVPDPATLIAEAARILREGGRVVVCDSDFSKATLAGAALDPLDCCAQAFVHHYVTDAHLTGKLRALLTAAGLSVRHFDLSARVVTDRPSMRQWVSMPAADMVGRGEIGQPLADALLAEHDRRVEAGTLYGYQPFVTAIAEKGPAQ